MSRLNIGLIGLGRLGQVYARDLSSRIAATRLTAVADTNASLAESTARTFDVPAHYTDPLALIDDPKVDAVVIVSPTSMHTDQVEACAARGKPTFCEKPPSIHLDGAQKMKEAVERSGILFQMGLMRRFDRGYATAKARVDAGDIGTPVVFKSSSRDPFRPSVEYANPVSSGGMIADMGIHDFDLARWYMGDVATVQAIGATLAYPELGEVGDIDNAIVSMTFTSGKLGEVDLSRNGIYGYDISTELLGTAGTIRIGYLRETPILVMTKNSIAHDTVPYFMERFRDAYTVQLENFAENVLHQRAPAITIDDGVEALRVAIAATRARETGERVTVADCR